MKINKKVDIGIVILLFILGYTFVSNLFSLKSPLYQLGPYFLTGASGIVIVILINFILAVLFFGLFKRKMWSRYATISWYTFIVIHKVFDLIIYLSNKSYWDNYYLNIIVAQTSEQLTPGLILVGQLITFFNALIFGLVVIWYLKKKKNYFVN